MKVKKRIFISLFVAIGLFSFSGSSFAAGGVYYQNLLSKRFGVDISSPPVDSVKLNLPQEKLSPFEFKLTEPADFLLITLNLGQEFVPGKIIFDKRVGEKFQEVWSREGLVPEIFINNKFGRGDFKVIISQELKDISQTATVGIEAFRYKRLPSDYLDSDWYLFVSSETPSPEPFLEAIIKQKRVLFLCDEASPVNILGHVCQFDSLVPLPGDLTGYRNNQGKNFILLPRENRNLLLFSPKVFSDDRALVAFKNLLDLTARSYPAPLKLTVGSLGRLVLDYYRDVFSSDWLRGSVTAILFLIVLEAILGGRRMFSYSSIQAILVRARVYFFLSLSRTRGFSLFFFVLFLAEFIVAFNSNKIVEILRIYGPVHNGYLSIKERLGQSFSFNDLRHILEAIFLTGAGVALAVSFLDKIMFLTAKIIVQIAKFSEVRTERFSKLIFLVFSFLVIFRLLGVPKLILYPTASLFFLLMFIDEIKSFKFRLLKTTNTLAPRSWFFSYLALVGLFVLGFLIRQMDFSKNPSVFPPSDLQPVTADLKLKLVALPHWSISLGRGQKYINLQVFPNQPLWADDYLVFYPGASQIVYLGEKPNLATVQSDRTTTVYVRPNKLHPESVLKELTYLDPFLSSVNFKSLPNVKSQVVFNPDYHLRDERYFFYVSLVAGENPVEVSYLNLNLSARPISSVVKVYGTKGDLVAKSVGKNPEYFLVQKPENRSARHLLSIPREGIYIIEISFEEETSFLSLGNKVFLQSLEFPSSAVYYLRPEIFNNQNQGRSVEVKNTAVANPFIFTPTDFGQPADQVLVFGFGQPRVLNLANDSINLGQVLNILKGDRQGTQKFLINYGSRAEFLHVSEGE